MRKIVILFFLFGLLFFSGYYIRDRFKNHLWVDSKFISNRALIVATIRLPIWNRSNVVLIDIQGKILENISGSIFAADWAVSPSPDGRYLVYVSRSGTGTRICLYDFETKQRKIIINSGFYDFNPQFLSDGETVVFLRSTKTYNAAFGTKKSGVLVAKYNIRTNQTEIVSKKSYFAVYDLKSSMDSPDVVWLSDEDLENYRYQKRIGPGPPLDDGSQWRHYSSFVFFDKNFLVLAKNGMGFGATGNYIISIDNMTQLKTELFVTSSYIERADFSPKLNLLLIRTIGDYTDNDTPVTLSIYDLGSKVNWDVKITLLNYCRSLLGNFLRDRGEPW